MNYAELKKAYDSARMELASLDSESSRLKAAITKEDNTRQDMINELEKQLLADKARALDEYKTSRIKPIEEKLSALTLKLEETEKEYSEKSNEITFDNVLVECSSKQDILDNVKESTSILTEKLQQIVGKRFYKSLMQQVNTDKITLDIDSIEPVINYFNRSSKKLGKLKTDANFLDKAMQVMENLSSNKENKSVLLVVSVILIVCVFLFPMYLAIFVILLITVSITYNIFRNYNIYQTLCVVMSVEANIDEIESAIHEEVAQEVERRKEELDNTMLPQIESLKNDINETRQDMIDTEQEVGSSFLYDSTAFNEQRSNAEKQISDRKTNLLVQKSQIDEQIKEKALQIKAFEDKLANCVEEIKRRLMSSIGTEMEFKPEFIIDFKNNKPVTWKHPKTSSLILYRDQADLYNFIKLLIIQLRGKLLPSCLSVTIVDYLNMGQPLRGFGDARDVKGGEDFIKPTFNIDFNEEQWKEDLNVIIKNLTLRQRNIGTEFGTIEKYNKKMLELEAIPEKYKFIFMIEPDLTTLSNLNVTQIMRTGDMVGIYLHAFISIKALQTNKNNSIDLLSNVKTIYSLEDDVIKRKAKDFIVSQYLSDGRG